MLETKLTPEILQIFRERHRADVQDWNASIAKVLGNSNARSLTIKQRLRRWWRLTLRNPRPLGHRYLAPTIYRGQAAAQWAARWPRVDYRQVAPAYESQFSAENLHFPHPALASMGWRKGPFRVPPLFTIDIPCGRTVGRRGAILTPDDYLLTDVSREFFRTPGQHPIYHLTSLPPIRPLKGRYAILNGPGGSTYHWLLDSVTRYSVLLAAGYTADDFDGFLLAEPKYAPQAAVIDLIGIPREKIHWCTRLRHYECDHLVVPSFTNNEREHHPLALDYLHSLVPRPAPGQKRRRLYISRRDSLHGRRRIVNEAAVEALLAHYGFESVLLAPLSFEDQTRLFAEAEIVIAPHGGGCTHICFADRPFLLIELFAPDYSPTYFRSIARQRGFDYQAIVGRTVGHGTTNGADIGIDVAQLQALLEKMDIERLK